MSVATVGSEKNKELHTQKDTGRMVSSLLYHSSKYLY